MKWNKKMKVARVIKDLTQAQAAEVIGVSLRTYLRWENGETKPKTEAEKVAAIKAIENFDPEGE